MREIAKVRETEPQREIVYMDETWLNEGHRLQKEWVDLVTLNKANRKLLYNEGPTVGCTKTQVGKGKRLIMTPMQCPGGTHDIFGRGCATIKSLYRPFLEFLKKTLDPFRNFCD